MFSKMKPEEIYCMVKPKNRKFTQPKPIKRTNNYKIATPLCL